MVGLLASGLTGLPLAAYTWWAAFGVVLTFVDLAVQRLPARLTYAAVTGLLFLLLIDAQITHNWQPWTRAVLGGMITSAIVAGCALALPTLVHWGDVRYGLAIGAAAAWVGWLTWYTAAFLAALAGALVGIGLVVRRKATMATHLPQGPFWYIGAMIAIVLSMSRIP